MITSVVGAMEAAASLDPTPVPWWSFTKTVLAAAALALVAKRRLDLDAALEGRAFTLRHLLQHRSGLPDYGHLTAYHAAVADRGMPWPRRLLLQSAGAHRLVFEPGQGWAYSNIGYMLVREWIEDAADAELGQALDRLVFSPLGITDVVVAREPADIAETAWGNASGYHPGWVYHGLLVGPACSAAVLLHGELLPPSLLSDMLTPHPLGGPIAGRPWRTTGYGLGLMIGTGETGATCIGHTGGGPGSMAAIYQSLSGLDGDNPRRTAAVFATGEDLALVESRAMRLAGS